MQIAPFDIVPSGERKFVQVTGTGHGDTSSQLLHFPVQGKEIAPSRGNTPVPAVMPLLTVNVANLGHLSVVSCCSSNNIRLLRQINIYADAISI